MKSVLRSVAMRTPLFAILLSIVASGLMPAAAVDVTASLPETALTKFVAREGSKFITATSGVVVVDAKTGETVHTKNPLRGFMPASTMKLVTAVVALHSLGPSFRFKTTATWNAETSTLYLTGSGDPILRSKQLKELATKVATAIGTGSKITLRVDATMYPAFTMPPGWLKSQIPFNARPVTALVVDDRKTRQPAQDAGEIFSRYLRSAGVKNSFVGTGKASGTEVAKVTGLPATVAIRQMLHQSNNDIAEMLFRDSAVYSGKAGTWESARSHAYSVISELGLKMDNIKLVDGSGLSRGNRLSASALATLLGLALDPAHPELAPLATADLLPQAGSEGTLVGRFRYGRTACANGLVEAKTGSLHDVISLAGYAQNAEGGLAAFSIIVNKIPRRSMQSSVRNAIDWMVTALVGCTTPTS